MPRISLTLPDSIHAKIEEIAERDGISVDQFLTSAAAEKLAACLGEEYLDERARRSSREAFEHALAQVPNVPPVPGDEL